MKLGGWNQWISIPHFIQFPPSKCCIILSNLFFYVTEVQGTFHRKQVFRKRTQLCSNFIDNQFTPVCSSFSTLSTCIQLISCERYSHSTFHHDLSNKCQVRKTNETFRRGGRILEVTRSISGKGGLKLAWKTIFCLTIILFFVKAWFHWHQPC